MKGEILLPQDIRESEILFEDLGATTTPGTFPMPPARLKGVAMLVLFTRVGIGAIRLDSLLVI